MNRPAPIAQSIEMEPGLVVVPRKVRVHLHADASALPASYITALDLDVPHTDIIVFGEHMYRLDEAASTRHRRPTYVRATYLITGPTARRAGIAPAGSR